MKRHPILVGNWKMHGSRSSSVELMSSIASGVSMRPVDVALCVPFPLLQLAEETLGSSTVAWGAQTLSENEDGAHTGDVSARMLREFGCSYVIVGHSERRSAHGESDEVVAAKTRTALQARLTPIVCVGETVFDREAGLAKSIILRQLDAVMSTLDEVERERCIVAYEPVWAIGTGLTATPEQAAEAHGWIRSRIAEGSAVAAESIRILYGGSVKPSGAKDLFSMPGIDGALVGGASLISESFVAIAAAAA
ncbi:triose-phosphate isomerase [Variovorax humicola]|uniref:Triosephosphate isomerase n=1 Tax=Variovorax humicola TaxID=1769758 RepID=A0ABU8VY77_9BURK